MRLHEKTASLQTVNNSLDIVEALEELDGARISELATHIDLSKSSIHKHLVTLKRRGYVMMDGDEYHIALRFVSLGEYAKYRTPARRKLLEFAKNMPDFGGLHIGVVIEENGRGVYLKPESGKHTLTASQEGKQVYLHSTAAGKAILANLPDEKVDKILEYWGMPKLTENTIRDRDTLDQELNTIREQGFAINNGESIEGIQAIATAVTNPNGTNLGAISVRGPQYQFDNLWYEEELTDELIQQVNQLEQQL